jgi:hypothetical protein
MKGRSSGVAGVQELQDGIGVLSSAHHGKFHQKSRLFALDLWLKSDLSSLYGLTLDSEFCNS